MAGEAAEGKLKRELKGGVKKGVKEGVKREVKGLKYKKENDNPQRYHQRCPKEQDKGSLPFSTSNKHNMCWERDTICPCCELTPF